MIRNYLDLVKSALEQVESDYYHVPTVYDPIGNARERVFCYELYHQMRLIGVNNEFTLHGELDKSGHHDFRGEKPDFLFHVPGTHERNLLVIEVKGILLYELVQDDIRKLLLFVTRYHYQAGLFIIFNDSLQGVSRALNEVLDDLQVSPGAEKIVIMAIQADTQRCEECTL